MNSQALQRIQIDWALCPRLLSAILPNRVAELIFPSSHRVTIDMLPDDVLLRIFHFDRVIYLDVLAALDRQWRPSLYWGWHRLWGRLVHVCQRWRSVVFASPNTLDLRLICGPRTLVEFTRIWPPLPIILRGDYTGRLPGNYDFDAAIVHPNRVCEINLHLSKSQLRRLVSAMQEQFPALIHLTLSFFDNDCGPALTLPDGFLGGSGLRLQSLELDSIPFPALPKLLLSANDLVRLNLKNISHSGYFSSEAIVTGLAVMTSLKTLTIKFESPLFRPQRENRRPPPPTRAVLPALIHFKFKGTSEYLEDIVARIDAPLLDTIYITFFHQLIFDIPRLAQFMRRTTKFQELKEAHVDFDGNGVHVEPLPPTRSLDEKSGLGISCKELDWQLSSLAQVFTSFFTSIYLVERLYIYEPRYQREDDFENVQWLEIFQPFTAVKSLYLSEKCAPRLAPALQELVGGRAAEVLPTLQKIYLEGPQEGLRPSGPIPEGIQKFVAARQLTGHPITVFLWGRVSGVSVLWSASD